MVLAAQLSTKDLWLSVPVSQQVWLFQLFKVVLNPGLDNTHTVYLSQTESQDFLPQC